MGPNMVDEIDCGNLFDQIDDLIEFPPESAKDFPSMWSDALAPFFSKLSVPFEDIVQLEWLSTFVEDSFSVGKESSGISSHNQFQTSSPVTVVESSSSSSSCSVGKTTPISPSHCGVQRARSKRPRPLTFNPRAAIQLLSPPPSFIAALPEFILTSFSSESKNIVESPPTKKMKIAMPVTSSHCPREGAMRKCMHCEITKTPQWRAGPMGAKSLCNACGVRYKSGRLFPEYRPAASPTFVPSLHSNSHKKVVEMRTKLGGEPTTTPSYLCTVM